MKSRFFRHAAPKVFGAALILSSPRDAPQRTLSRLDLAKGSMGAKSTVEHGNTSPGPPGSVICTRSQSLYNPGHRRRAWNSVTRNHPPHGGWEFRNLPRSFAPVTPRPPEIRRSDAMRWLLESSTSRFFRLRHNIVLGPAALNLPSPRGAPQRTRSGLDLAKGYVGVKATTHHGNTSPEPPDLVI